MMLNVAQFTVAAFIAATSLTAVTVQGAPLPPSAGSTVQQLLDAQQLLTAMNGIDVASLPPSTAQQLLDSERSFELGLTTAVGQLKAIVSPQDTGMRRNIARQLTPVEKLAILMHQQLSRQRRGFWDDVGDAFEDAADTVGNGVEDAASDVASAVTDSSGYVADAVESATGAVQDQYQKFKDALDTLPDGTGEIIDTIIDSMVGDE